MVPVDASIEKKQACVDCLIEAYRSRGHLLATLDPLQLGGKPRVPLLEPSYYHLTEMDMAVEFHQAPTLGKEHASLNHILDALRTTYCGSIGFEYMHIRVPEEIDWIQQRIESDQAQPQFSSQQQHDILHRLVCADGLEKYLGNKYVGTEAVFLGRR